MEISKKIIIEKMLQLYGYVDLVATGNSMEPILHSGDTVRVYYSKTSYHIDDMIAYWSNDYDKIIIHRIVATTNKAVFTKGDNNKEIDEVVSFDKIIGKCELSNTGIKFT